jgi:hypothetical protein
MGALEPSPAAHNVFAEKAGWGTRCYTALEFERPELNALRDVWFEIASRKSTPTRADFDARTLKPFLNHVTFVDRFCGEDSRPRYRIRLMGSEVARLFGEQTGRFVDEFIPPQNLPRWTMGYDVVMHAGVPLRFTSRFELPQVSFLDGESFSAPLARKGDTPSGILSALYVKPKESLGARAG